MRLITTLVAFLATLTAFAQPVPAATANWKNNAKGAYSIIHDDYGNAGVDGIWQYADTIAFNRGLKFTFGAISSDCEVARSMGGSWQTPYTYAKDVMMALHNHEIINHTHTHTCAVNRGWGDCNGTGWGEVKGSWSWNTELNTSHTSIINGTGFQPRYFIFPYDQFTDEANDELKVKGYIGSRTGWHVDGIHNTYYKWGYDNRDENMFPCDADGFFRTSVEVFDANDASLSVSAQTQVLNSEVDSAIWYSEWANRELHNVGWSGWGYVKTDAYRAHMNYVQSKVATGELWVPTMSEMLTYQIQKLVYTPNANYDASKNEVAVSFTEDHSVYAGSVSSYLSGLALKEPLTIVVDISSHTSSLDTTALTVMQGATTITDFTYSDDTVLVNLYPHEGDFVIGDSNPVSAEAFDLSDFGVYPNPANDIVYVDGDVQTVNVFTAAGTFVKSSFGNQLSVAELSPGVYFLQVNNSSNRLRLVVQ